MRRVNDTDNFEIVSKNKKFIIDNRSLMNKLKRIGPRTEPCDTPDIT
jgi:hypothetical protein